MKSKCKHLQTQSKCALDVRVDDIHGISSIVQWCTNLAFGLQWFCYNPVDEIAEMQIFPKTWPCEIPFPPCSSRENFKILDTTWPPAPRMVKWKIVSSGFRSVQDCKAQMSDPAAPSPILLSHPLTKGCCSKKNWHGTYMTTMKGNCIFQIGSSFQANSGWFSKGLPAFHSGK